MREPSSDNIPDLLARLAIALHDALGVTARSIDVHVIESERPVSLPVLPRWGGPTHAPDRAGALPTAERLTALERRLLRAVAGLEVEEPTAEEIAAAAKVKNEPYLRRLLSSLRQRGLLEGERGQAGYGLSPAGLAALEPEGGAGQ